ncbi:MAG: VCBS repeat-containing protein [Anaerolineales bacterium]
MNDSAQPHKSAYQSHLLRGFLILAGLILALFLAYWIYMFFFFSFERPPRVQEISLADLTGNGYLDAYLAIGPGGEPYQHPDYVLFNQGDGHFIDSGQSLDNFDSNSVKLGDLTGDGYIDAAVAHYSVSIYRNDGQGFFPSGQRALTREPVTGQPGDPATGHLTIAMGDLDGDGLLDIFGATCCGGTLFQPEYRPLPAEDIVWIGDGEGGFVQSRQLLAQTGSNAVALGDLNGDGFLDAFIASGHTMDPDQSVTPGTPNTVWLNDGGGNFRDSGQRLGQMESLQVALGDLNNDGFPDAVVGNRGQDEIWLNDGQGNFTLDQQTLGSQATRFVFVADLSGDGHVDIFIGDDTRGQVWFNDGAGVFTAGDQLLKYNRYDGISLGDVTGDGSIDVFIAGVNDYQVWRNDGQGRFSAAPRTQYR